VEDQNRAVDLNKWRLSMGEARGTDWEKWCTYVVSDWEDGGVCTVKGYEKDRDMWHP